MARRQASKVVRADGLAEVVAIVGSNNLSMNTSPMMAITNPVSGYGTSRDSLAYTQVNSPVLLNHGALDGLYMHWVCRRIVDHVADEITKAGWTVRMGLDSNAKAVPGIQQAMRSLNVKSVFNEAIKAARQYGGATVIMYLNDGRSADQPVDWENLRSIEGLEPVDRWHLLPDIQPETVRYSNPERYQLLIEDASGLPLTYIHRERVLRFEGLRLPFRLQQNNQGWGMSVLQPLLESVSRYSGGLGDLGQMLHDLDVFTHKIKGLASMLAAGKEKQVVERLAVNDLSKSQYRGFAIDADKEEIEFQSRDCSGLSQILQTLKDDLLGATGFPATILFGSSPSGPSSTGRSEEREFTRTVETYREHIVEPPLMQLAYAVMKAKDGPTKGRVPDDWSVGFPSLFVLSEREAADLRARVAAADYRYWLMGAVTSAEIAMSRYGGAEWSSETTLDMANREADGSLAEDKIEELLRIQGKADPHEAMTSSVDGPPGIRGLSATGERSDPTDNENGSIPIDGQRSVAEDDPSAD